MPEWLWVILIGGVILGLVSLIYGYQSQRLTKVEEWKETRPMTEEILTKSSHSIICKDNLKDLKNILMENREALINQIESVKEYLDVKIERDILVEIRKLNGKK